MTDVERDTAALAATAVDALQAEALLTPKPGLVDRLGPGGHADMDLAMLLRSAESLRDTFVDLALVPSEGLPLQEFRDRVGVLGRSGEATMLAATGGVNTHRGALWTVGLLVTAAGSTRTEEGIVISAAQIAAIPDSAASPTRSSHGQRVAQRYRVGGAVGEAVAGFPHITRVALPALRAARASGDSEERARQRALLALIATVDDTCVLHRGGLRGLRWMQRTARRTSSAKDFFGALERFASRADAARLSPGGSADLLAATIFLDDLARFREPAPALQELIHADV
jgi:triphosphoribosyl-dephospho-CoA synthase